MELDATDRVTGMPHTHNVTIIEAGRSHLQIVRQRFPLRNKGMVARCGERCRNAGKDPGACMPYQGGLSMHQVRCPDNLSAKYTAYGLVPKADPKGRYCPAHGLQHAPADSGIL